jgi:osmotically inducible lipoprotein OsmB
MATNKIKLAVLMIGFSAIALSACTTTQMQVAGAGTGAVAGAAVAGPVGAVVGGVAGAVAGPTVATAAGVPHRHRHCWWSNGVRRCRYW